MLIEGKEHDKKMKKEIHRDHLAEMFGGADFSKQPIQTETKRAFGTFLLTKAFTDEFKEELKGHQWENHFVKNDLNQYNEAYLKYKDTMRKFTAPEKK